MYPNNTLSDYYTYHRSVKFGNFLPINLLNVTYISEYVADACAPAIMLSGEHPGTMTKSIEKSLQSNLQFRFVFL